MELISALGKLAEAPGPEQVRLAKMLELPGEPTRTDYSDLFVVQLNPYASVYLSPDGRRITELQDHLSTIIGAYQQISGPVKQVFLWDHLVSWLLPFCARARELAHETYRAWVTMLLDALEEEIGKHGAANVLPLPLRHSRGINSALLDDIVSSLFAPVTSGIVLTRADLGRCAREIGMMPHIADRRYTMREFLVADSERVQRWIAAEARRQADAIAAMPDVFGAVRSHWEQRALQTADAINSITIQVTTQ